VTDIVDPALEAYAAAHTTAPPPHLEALAAETLTSLASPHMMVGRLEGRYLEMLVFALGATSVLEIGTFGGYSALAMAAGLGPGGRITSCELSPEHAAFARRHIAASPYADRIEVLEGPALETIASLPGPFDFVFIDADKASYPDYVEAVLGKLTPRGLIAADNTLWSGRILDPADTTADTVALRAFNDALAVDPRVVVVQTTVRDGVTLIRRAG
jgi:caffeoyl-CoA O-methyltransferase